MSQQFSRALNQLCRSVGSWEIPHSRQTAGSSRRGDRANHATYLSAHRGFTMIELMVVAAVGAVVTALLLPAVQTARGAARNQQCINNLKQLGLAQHNYHDIYLKLSPGWIGVKNSVADPAGGNGFSWAALQLPLIDQAAVYNRFDFNRDIDQQNDPAIWETVIPLFQSPDDPNVGLFDIDGRIRVGSLNYVVNFGSLSATGCYRASKDAEKGQPSFTKGQCESDGLFFHNSAVSFYDVSDGLSNTLMLGERVSTRDSGEHWGTWGGALPGSDRSGTRVVVDASVPLNMGEAGFGYGSHHVDGTFHVCFGDGSVKALTTEVDFSIFQALSTRAGGEIVSDF